jgi:site-specific DNA-cytosine methylase
MRASVLRRRRQLARRGGCTRTETMRLLGNAVCPPVMQAIVETLIGA